MLMSGQDVKSEKSFILVEKLDRPTELGFNTPVQGRLASAKARFGRACRRPDLRRTDPGRMVAYAKAQTMVYSKIIVELPLTGRRNYVVASMRPFLR